MKRFADQVTHDLEPIFALTDGTAKQPVKTMRFISRIEID